MTTQIQPDRLPPTTTTYIIATAIIAGITGYFVGQGATIGLFKPSTTSSARPKSRSEPASARSKSKSKSKEIRQRDDVSNEGDDDDDSENEEEEEVEEEEEEEEEEDSEDEGNGGELADFSGNTEEVKLVLVVRTDLGMTKGKMAAQCSHATLACYKYFLTHSPDSPMLRRWENGGQAKIALQVKSEDEMVLFQAQAMSLGLCARSVQDAGRTQIASGSRTVLGILGPKSVVDGVTGHLKLL